MRRHEAHRARYVSVVLCVVKIYVDLSCRRCGGRFFFLPRLCLIAVALFSDGSDGGRIELILARNQNVAFGSGGNLIRAFSRVDIEGRDPC